MAKRSTRHVTKEKLDQMIAKLDDVSFLASSIGLLYAESDSVVSPAMVLAIEMSDALKLVLEDVQKEV